MYFLTLFPTQFTGSDKNKWIKNIWGRYNFVHLELLLWLLLGFLFIHRSSMLKSEEISWTILSMPTIERKNYFRFWWQLEPYLGLMPSDSQNQNTGLEVQSCCFVLFHTTWFLCREERENWRASKSSEIWEEIKNN